MPRNYTHIKQYEDLILQLKEEGYSHREIGEMTGFTKEQIRGLIKRRNRMSRKSEEGYVPKPKGRPRVRPITTEEELRKELERLQMENDLLRDFLLETERK
jgi:transposase